MAINSKYEFFLSILTTGLNTLITGADADLVVLSGNAYANSNDSKKIGCALGDRTPNAAMQTADRRNRGELDSTQSFIVLISEEIEGSVNSLDELEERVGYWCKKLDYLFRNLGAGQQYKEELASGTPINIVKIVNVTVDKIAHFAIEEGNNGTPEIGIFYTCKFDYDQINI